MNNLLPEVLQNGAQASSAHAAGTGVSEGGIPENPFGQYETEDVESSVPSAVAVDIEKPQAAVELKGSKNSIRSDQWTPDKDMLEFFQIVKQIDERMVEVRNEVTLLHSLHIKSKITSNISTVKDLREEMAVHIGKASILCRGIQNDFKAIESTRKAKLSTLSTSKLRMREAISAAKKKQFKKLMAEFSNLRASVQADYKEIVTRRYKTVTGIVPTDDEIESLIQSGESENIFQKAILEQGRGQIQDTLNEIDERHRAMQEIERGLLELNQIFMDFATVVEQQSEVLDNIEQHVDNAAEFTGEGTKALQISAQLHKSIQRKKLCIVILVIIGLIILVVILWPVISKLVDTANAQANKRAAELRERLAEEAQANNNSSQP